MQLAWRCFTLEGKSWRRTGRTRPRGEREGYVTVSRDRRPGYSYSGSPIGVERSQCSQVAFSSRKSHLARCRKHNGNWRTAVMQSLLGSRADAVCLTPCLQVMGPISATCFAQQPRSIVAGFSANLDSSEMTTMLPPCFHRSDTRLHSPFCLRWGASGAIGIPYCDKFCAA